MEVVGRTVAGAAAVDHLGAVSNAVVVEDSMRRPLCSYLLTRVHPGIFPDIRFDLLAPTIDC